MAELTEEQDRYNDIQLDAETVTQDNVEKSLLRSEAILEKVS